MIARVIKALPFGLYSERWIASDTVRGAQFQSHDGRTLFVLSRNMDPMRAACPWRVSRLDAATGEPIGHTYGRDAQEAIDNGIHGWGRVTLIEQV